MADPRRSPTERSRASFRGRRRIPVDGNAPDGEASGIEELAGFDSSEDPLFGESEIEEIIIEDEPGSESEPSFPDGGGEPPAELVEEIRELRESLVRQQAEFENYRKRQAREFRRLSIQGKRELMIELLAVLDNFDRAVAHRDENGHPPEEVSEGMFLTADLMRRILDQEGLKALDVRVSDPFDPNIHEAMMATEVEGLVKDTVLEILQKGYLLNDELLRPARVKVGKPAPGVFQGGKPPDEDEGGPEEE